MEIVDSFCTMQGDLCRLGVASGPLEAKPFRKTFLRSLANRGLRGVNQVIADDRKSLREKLPKLADMMDASREGVLARSDQTSIHRLTNPHSWAIRA